MQVTTIGLDIAKNVFQVHGIDAAEKVVVRKQLRRSQVLWRWHLPTRWPASPGHCWSRAAPIGRVHWWQWPKGTGDGRMRLRMCVHELQG